MGPRVYNTLPVELTEIDLKKFKVRWCKWFLMNPFYGIQVFEEAQVNSI